MKKILLPLLLLSMVATSAHAQSKVTKFLTNVNEVLELYQRTAKHN